jgi:hypothetical protein
MAQRPGQVARDCGQTAWITDAGAIAVFDQPLYPGETTEAGPLWPSGNLRCQSHGLLFTIVHG